MARGERRQMNNQSQENDQSLLLQEMQRLKNSVAHLLRSNQALRDEDPADVDFQQAIAENVLVIDKQLNLIKKLQAHLQLLVPSFHALDSPSPQNSPSANSLNSPTPQSDYLSSHTPSNSTPTQQQELQQNTDDSEGTLL